MIIGQPGLVPFVHGTDRGSTALGLHPRNINKPGDARVYCSQNQRMRPYPIDQFEFGIGFVHYTAVCQPHQVNDAIYALKNWHPVDRAFQIRYYCGLDRLRKRDRMARRRPNRIAGAQQSGDERPTNKPGASVTNMRCGVMSPHAA